MTLIDLKTKNKEKNEEKMRDFLSIGVALLLFSCGSNTTFEEYKKIQNQEWHTDSLILFSFQIEDTISKHTISLNIRHTIDYEYQNLLLFVCCEESKDTTGIFLADKNGKWKGTGIGDLREHSIVLEKNKTFKEKREYKYSFEQAMRYGPKEKIMQLKYIEALGLRVVKEQ